jgi:hypothetical protein
MAPRPPTAPEIMPSTVGCAGSSIPARSRPPGRRRRPRVWGAMIASHRPQCRSAVEAEPASLQETGCRPPQATGRTASKSRYRFRCSRTVGKRSQPCGTMRWCPEGIPRPVMILWIAPQASVPGATDVQGFRARRCRSRRCGSAMRDRSASRISCRRRSGRCGRWR